MTKFATIVIPFAYTPKWGQIVISSLKAFKNDRDFDILISNNTPERPDIKAVTETSLGEEVKVFTPENRMRWSHAGALDEGIKRVNTPYFFSLETDCTIERDGWLDWYASFVKDEHAAMAGWYWVVRDGVADDRHYINSSATLYNTRILKQLAFECENNKETTISYGENYEKRKTWDHFIKMVEENQVGPFAEQRGFFHNGYPFLLRGHKWWQEPGNWLYSRALCQWECAKVPGKTVLFDPPQSNASPQKCNYYGESEEKAYVIHWWGGTVSHNFDKHMVIVPYEVTQLEWWLTREHRMWEERVPEFVKKQSLEKGLVRTLGDDLKYAKSRCHLLQPGQKVRLYRTQMDDYIMGKYPMLPDGFIDAEVVVGFNYEGRAIVKFPGGLPDPPYVWWNSNNKECSPYQEKGVWYAEAHPCRCVKC